MGVQRGALEPRWAVAEGHGNAVREIDEQIAESQEHAERFRATLEKAAKRFAALAKVEERHANHYRAALAKVGQRACPKLN